jgi:hypothetical protein
MKFISLNEYLSHLMNGGVFLVLQWRMAGEDRL